MTEPYFDYCDTECKYVHTHTYRSSEFDSLIVAQVLKELISPNSDKPYQDPLWIMTANVFIKKYKEIKNEG